MRHTGNSPERFLADFSVELDTAYYQVVTAKYQNKYRNKIFI